MKLKNAGIKSKKELVTRLMNGEVFYRKDVKVYFDESKLNPFRACGLNTECVSSLMGLVWDYFHELEIEYRWEDELKNGLILCWVSDLYHDEKEITAYIESEVLNDNEYNYIDKNNSMWRYATPVQPSECLNMED